MPKGLIIVAPYPPRGSTYGSEMSALASFGKNTVEALKQNQPELKIIVLADVLGKEKGWREGRLEVKRLWARGRLEVYGQLLKEIKKQGEYKSVLIELEWGLFGTKPWLIALMPWFILALRLMGKKVTVVLHSVLFKIKALAPQIGLTDNWKLLIYRWGVEIYYSLLIIFCNKLIVLEQHFAEVLNKKYKSEKVVFIPHGVDTKLRLIDKTIAKRKLGLPQDQLMLMSFGFLKWYKGSDILAEKFFRFVKRYPHEKVLLVFAGGESQAHKKVPNYRQFVNKIKQIAEKTKKVIVTGFLPREEMIKYLSAADVLLFPYRTFISSSGPLSLAFSFKKPVWLSNKLKPYFKSVDIKKALKLGGVNQSGMLFSLAGNGLDNKILNWNRGQTEFESQKFSELMSNSRNWKKIGRQYLAVLK